MQVPKNPGVHNEYSTLNADCYILQCDILGFLLPAQMIYLILPDHTQHANMHMHMHACMHGINMTMWYIKEFIGFKEQGMLQFL